VGEGQALLSLADAQVGLAAQTRVSVPRARTVNIEEGELSITTHGLVVVAAGAYRIEAAFAVFLVRAESRGVTVTVRDGSVRVGDLAVNAGGSWSSVPPELPSAPRVQPVPQPHPAPAPIAPAVKPVHKSKPRATARVEEPAPAAVPAPLPDARETDDALNARARSAEAQGRYGEAAALYAELSQRSGPRAGTSLYQLARVRQRFLGQPAAALEALVHAVEGERIRLSRVEDALKRHQRAKERFLAAGVAPRPLGGKALQQALGRDEHRQIADEMAQFA